MINYEYVTCDNDFKQAHVLVSQILIVLSADEVAANVISGEIKHFKRYSSWA
jgi:hypothetical protein